ncbi:hypothetical protein [Holophaga foetida]|uniref:hypothetical protein n=1 Tax=Holophaga foetida TaxID=35839 RepID=UPI0003190984|nr:hypothetical protein [Holophaga foetida]
MKRKVAVMLLVRPLILATLMVLPGGAQSVSDRFRENYATWEKRLEKGDGSGVRKAAEAVIQKEGAAVNPSDYNEMRALVGAMDVAARACVLDGAWEDAVLYLQKASSTAAENLNNAEATFGKVRKEHEQKLQDWKGAVAQQEKRLKDLEAQPGLTEAQMKLRGQIRAFLEEHRTAIDHSEKALKEIDGLLSQIRNVRVAYEKSLEEWKTFLEKEKLEISQVGSSAKYVAEKLPQVRVDETKPFFDRLAYARRLKRLDPSNPGCAEFVSSLAGSEESTPTKDASPAKAKKKSSKRR